MAVPANTVVVQDAQAFLRGRAVPITPPAWSAKDPADIGDYVADFSQAVDPGAIVIQVDHSVVPPGGVDITSAFWANLQVQMRISGGVADSSPLIVISLTFEDGSHLTRSVLLPIVQQALLPPAVPLGALTVNGFAWTISGQSILF